MAETVAAMKSGAITAPPPAPSLRSKLENDLYQKKCADRMRIYGRYFGNEAEWAANRAREMQAYWKRQKEEESRRRKEWELNQIQIGGHYARRDEARSEWDSLPPPKAKKHASVDPIQRWCANRTPEAIKMAFDSVSKPYMSKQDKQLVREAAKYDKRLAAVAMNRGL